MVLVLLWCPVDFHGCGLFILIGFSPSSWLDSFSIVLWCFVDFRGCGLFMLTGFSRLLGWNPFFLLQWILGFFLYFISSYICGECCGYGIDVLVSLVSCELHGCGVFTLAGSLLSWLEYICYDDYFSGVL
jgi:hypothetical protein